jgi:hypothetical protein
MTFNFPDYESVRLVLEEKYRNMFNPNVLGTKLIDWTPNNFPGLYEYVESKFKPRRATVQRSRFFYTPGNTELGAHIDGHTTLKFRKSTDLYWALNLPIIIPTGHHIQQWYSYSGEYINHTDEKYTNGISFADTTLLIPTLSLVLDKPYFVNVGQPHSVNNFSSNPRLMLSLRFESSTVFQFMESLK